MTPTLSYLPGSPFARMARVLLREWSLPIAEEELPFPPPPDWFDVNPPGQVPVLRSGDEVVFPTLLVLERLWELAGRPAEAYDPGRDRQRLLVTLQAGDALVAALYQGWTGLRPMAENHIGYDPATRNLHRVAHALDWIEERTGPDGDLVALPSVALACLVLWSEARGGPARPHRPGLDRLVGRLELRPSFAVTQPQPWKPGREEDPPVRLPHL